MELSDEQITKAIEAFENRDRFAGRNRPIPMKERMRRAALFLQMPWEEPDFDEIDSLYRFANDKAIKTGDGRIPAAIAEALCEFVQRRNARLLPAKETPFSYKDSVLYESTADMPQPRPSMRPQGPPFDQQSKADVRVPEGMLKVACRAYPNPNFDWVDDEAYGHFTRPILEAALRWLSENPIVPTLPQLRAAESAAAHEPTNSTRWMADCLMEFQRRMFLAPAEEVPEEIKDLLVEPIVGMVNGSQVNDRVQQAYRRGLKASAATPDGRS